MIELYTLYTVRIRLLLIWQQMLYSHKDYVYTGAFYFMYGFKAMAFYPVHINPFMFVYGFSFENFFIFKAHAPVSR